MEKELLRPPGEYRDRKAGLVVFGVLTAFGGLFCWLMLALIIFAQVLAAKEGKAQPSQASLIAMLPLYAAWGLALVWLGIGSIMARRWARALLLICSWSWLIMGISGTVGAAVVMKKVLVATLAQAAAATHKPTADPNVIYVVMLACLVLFGVILPLIWLLFYRSRNVRLTCETRDPVPRWTDRCPLPVLGAVLWLVFGAAGTALVSLGSFRFLPFFGALVTGPEATVGLILFALVTIYAAWELYRLRWRGWWILVALICVREISTLLTYTQHDLAEIYRRLNYPPQTIEAVQRLGFGGSTLVWSSVVASLLALFYLIYLRKFFPPASAPASLGQSSVR